MPYVPLDFSTGPNSDFPSERPLSSAKIRQLAENVAVHNDLLSAPTWLEYKPTGGVVASKVSPYIVRTFNIETHGVPVLVRFTTNWNWNTVGGGNQEGILALSIQIDTRQPLVLINETRVANYNSSDIVEYIRDLPAGDHTMNIIFQQQDTKPGDGKTFNAKATSFHLVFRELPSAPVIHTS